MIFRSLDPFNVKHYNAQDFLRVFDTLKTELVNDPLIAGQPEFAQKWLQRVRQSAAVESVYCGKWSKCSLTRRLHMQMLEFNVPGGKLNRGMAVLDVLKALQGTEVSLHSDKS